MNFRPALVSLALLSTAAPACCDEPGPAAPDPEGRALAFLCREVPRWSRENHCFSCHNNGDAARALYAGDRIGPGDLRKKRLPTRPGGWPNPTAGSTTAATVPSVTSDSPAFSSRSPSRPRAERDMSKTCKSSFAPPGGSARIRQRTDHGPSRAKTSPARPRPMASSWRLTWRARFSRRPNRRSSSRRSIEPAAGSSITT